MLVNQWVISPLMCKCTIVCIADCNAYTAGSYYPQEFGSRFQNAQNGQKLAYSFWQKPEVAFYCLMRPGEAPEGIKYTMGEWAYLCRVKGRCWEEPSMGFRKPFGCYQSPALAGFGGSRWHLPGFCVCVQHPPMLKSANAELVDNKGLHIAVVVNGRTIQKEFKKSSVVQMYK